jgi:hypothetical protein
MESLEGTHLKPWVRRAHEMLFSLNVGLACIVGSVNSQYARYWELRLLNKIMALFHLGWHTEAGAAVRWITMLFLWIAGSATILLLAKVLKIFHLRRLLLRSIAGFAALVAAPTIWYFCYWETFLRPWQVLAAWEVIASVLCAFIYLGRKWSVPRWVGVFLLAAHCIFWCWYFWMASRSLSDVLLISPVLAFASSLSWGVYVSGCRHKPEACDPFT